MIPPTRSAPGGVSPIRTTWHSSEFSSVVVVAAAPGNKWCTTMSFPSNDNPYAQYHPASPVPSYQCSASSQSSASSFGVHSPLSTISSSSAASSSWLGAALLTMPIRPGGSTSSSSTTTSTTPMMNDSNTVDSFKTHIDSARERFSNGRALLLLEKFAGDNGNASSNITSLKSDFDHCRERGANLRALALLNETSEAIKRDDPPAGVVRARSFSTHVSAVPPEQLAESTRKPRALTEDHVETVAGMKGIHHLEREEWAKKRALWLMSFSSIA